MASYDVLIFDSLSENFKTPIGAIAAGREVSFRVRLSKRSEAYAPRLLFYINDEWDAPTAIIPMTLLRDELTAVWYQAKFIPPLPNLYFYRFDAMMENHRVSIMRDRSDGVGVVSSEGDHWQMTVYDSQTTIQNSVAGGLVYQIFPDSFFNSGRVKNNVPTDRVMQEWGDEPHWLPDEDGEYRCNHYFGGDLEGILQKIPYLKSLGVTALYLNPIFEAHSNHRYNTADYLKVDPLLGTNADFQKLCKVAKENDIKVILDGVFSHTGSDSVYFNKEGRYKGGAYQDKNSKYRKWYNFSEDGEYKAWWGFQTLPEVIETEDSYLKFLTGEKGVLNYWLKAGADGFRLDVADEIPDVALDKICKTIAAFDPKAPIIGEVWEDASNKFSYGERRRYFQGGQLNSVMNYPLMEAVIAFVKNGDYYSLYSTILVQCENYPKAIINGLMNNLSTHDTVRAITSLGGEAVAGSSREWQYKHNNMSEADYIKGKKLFKIATLLQYTLPGVPCVYYGDEAGMTGYKDPFNRGCYPWGDEDSELIDWFKALGEIRTSQKVLKNGVLSITYLKHDIFAFTRKTVTERLFVCVNRSQSARAPFLPLELNPSRATVLMGDKDWSVLPAMGMLVMRY